MGGEEPSQKELEVGQRQMERMQEQLEEEESQKEPEEEQRQQEPQEKSERYSDSSLELPNLALPARKPIIVLMMTTSRAPFSSLSPFSD